MDPLGHQTLIQRLHEWLAAGLITAQQASSIAAFEVQRPQLAPAPERQPAKAGLSGVEILTTLAVAIVLIGIFVLIYSTTDGVGTHGLLTTVVALAAGLAAYWFNERRTEVTHRASGSLAALATAAIGFGAGQLAFAGNIFVTTTSTFYGSPYADPRGDILLGSAIAAVLSTIALYFLPSTMLSLTATVGVFSTAGAMLSLLTSPYGVPTNNQSAATVLVSGAVLIGIAFLVAKHDADRNLMTFFAIMGASLPLYGLGGGPWIYLDVLGGAVSAAALIFGLRFIAKGLAYGGSLGVGGLIVDIGLRNFAQQTTSLALYLIFSGLVGIVGIIFVYQYLRRPPKITA